MARNSKLLLTGFWHGLLLIAWLWAFAGGGGLWGQEAPADRHGVQIQPGALTTVQCTDATGLTWSPRDGVCYALGSAPPAPATKQWIVADLPGVSIYGSWVNGTRVDVIDTTGVCLFIVRMIGANAAASPTVTAVPKTQLRPGVGCQ